MTTRAKKLEINKDCLEGKKQTIKKAKRISQKGKREKMRCWYIYTLQRGSSDVNCEYSNWYVKVSWSGY